MNGGHQSVMCNMRFHLLFFLSLILSSLIVSDAYTISSNKLIPQTRPDPLSPKASMIRYWNKHISNTLPKPTFLISKASPLTAVDSAKLVKLAADNSLASHLILFCSLANLFCSFDAVKSDQPESRPNINKDANFISYSSKPFVNYGTSRIGGADTFKNYSEGLNTPGDSFKIYSKDSHGHNEGFTNYAKDGNVATANFTSYGGGTNGGSGEFKAYQERVNVPNLRFASYDSGSKNHKLSFSSYSHETNSGAESFVSYGKNGNSVPTEFTSYSDDGNTIGSGFTGYSELGKSANDTFKGYGDSGNNPHNDFKIYGSNGNSGIDDFISYRDGANIGEDSFQSYARNSVSGKVNFVNYGNTFNRGNDTFKEYGKGSNGRPMVGFKIYSVDRSFKDYIKGATFAAYKNESLSLRRKGNLVNRWVEPGKFFRESELRQGNVMVMPDIKDKMPKRSFLPRTILTKLPFSTARAPELMAIFGAAPGSGTERVVGDALTECERVPTQGENKQCVGSVEDMIDFSTSILGENVVVRTTENVNGSKRKIMIGLVKGINGGRLTKSVSCHQSLYPYLLYYCHSVPKVRVYEVDIHDMVSEATINRGVAICHIDTSAWGAGHGAFVALGSSPGRIEVCHWIFENDMTWTIAD